MEQLPKIELRFNSSAKYYRLFIDDIDVTPWHSDKRHLGKIIKQRFGICYRTDPRIIRNYIERTQKIVQQRNKIKLIINKPLN